MITFINHACFIVESGGVKLLCDPWIAGSAFHDGWNLITEEEHPGIHDVDYIWRSEEHTSELQSLMRISYAVFCLKKKNNPHKKKQMNICNNTNTSHNRQPIDKITYIDINNK